jgi:predicted RNA-binding Zn-ribbon protein involved in translation (DUF1610 family)
MSEHRFRELDQAWERVQAGNEELKAQYEPRAEETGNCPNCAEVIVRELVYRDNVPVYYWPCTHCGFTHYGADIPALD